MPTPEERRRRILEEGRHPRGDDLEEVPHATSDQPINAPEPRPLAAPLIVAVLVVVLFVIAIGIAIWARYQG